MKTIKAIVYKSNTGYTKTYAEMLAQKTGIPCYDLNTAKRAVTNGSDVIFMGWLMAGTIKGYKTAKKKFNIAAVCGIGMSDGEFQYQHVVDTNKLSDTPAFVLQGGFDLDKLTGPYKLMMQIMKSTAGKGLSEKTDRTPMEEDMLDLLTNGGSRVKEENLKDIIDWINA